MSTGAGSTVTVGEVVSGSSGQDTSTTSGSVKTATEEVPVASVFVLADDVAFDVGEELDRDEPVLELERELELEVEGFLRRFTPTMTAAVILKYVVVISISREHYSNVWLVGRV